MSAPLAHSAWCKWLLSQPRGDAPCNCGAEPAAPPQADAETLLREFEKKVGLSVDRWDDMPIGPAQIALGHSIQRHPLSDLIERTRAYLAAKDAP